MTQVKNEPRLGDPIPAEILKNAEKEIKSGYHSIVLTSFRDQEDVELHISHPTTQEESFASDQYAKVYGKLIKDPDLMTKTQMAKVLEQRGLWGKEQEDEVKNLREEMGDIELKVANLRKKKNYNRASVNKWKIEWFKRKDRIQDLLTEQISYLSNTVEGRAQEEEMRAKLSLCVRFPNQEKVWDNFEAIHAEKDKVALMTLVGEAMVFWAGLTQEIIDDLPARLVFGGEEEDQETSKES